ncbi:filamentous hemagglutinin N-terminal domain-containing protein [Ketobacter sp. MCCC 1A13808]|nr:filamentous hemagglutinin N-terminal domain-containing protein [Ketobacter sp. MCCC 1A13808]RLP55981.1 MAG: filamentous hemagglutinin N-terminal domain-containing protein [Ketobacter sp.]
MAHTLLSFRSIKSNQDQTMTMHDLNTKVIFTLARSAPFSRSLRSVLMACLLAMPPIAVSAPVLDNVVSGDADITSGPTTTINQVSQNAAIDWRQFDISPGESVEFIQPDINSIALNRDLSGTPSELFGSLIANGQVMLLNSAGILIGNGSSIDVGSLVLSDMTVSDETMATFGGNGSAGPLAFTDEEFAAGGITVMGNIVTNQPGGLTLMGQYLYLESGETYSGEANTDSAYGNTDFIVGGSAILVTDPNGYYGVELNTITPVDSDISPNAKFIEGSETPGRMVFHTNNGDVNFVVRYYSDTKADALSIREQSIQVLGDGNTSRNILAVTRPPSIRPDTKDEIDNTITVTLNDEPEEATSTSTSPEEVAEQRGSSLDNYMASCEPVDRNDRECLRQNAIKRYLGKLLIGGSLPD